MTGGCQRDKEPAEGATVRILQCRAAKPDLAVPGDRRHGLTAVAERRLTLGALDERNNAGVVSRVHFIFPEHRYDAFRIIAF